MRDTLIYRYLSKDVRTFTEDDDKDWINTYPNPFEIVGDKETSVCNQQAIRQEFLKVKNQTKVIVEIGVSRITSNQSYNNTTTSVFLNEKLPDTIYLGIDIGDRSFLDNPNLNIYTLRSKSEDYKVILNKLKELGITQIDFLFIDGWHSTNQVIDELWYVDFMKPGGIVGFHDINYHPGPKNVINNLRPERFEVTKYCTQPDDWGIGFAKLV